MSMDYPRQLSFMDGIKQCIAILYTNYNDKIISKCELCGMPPNRYSIYTLESKVGVHADCALYISHTIFGAPGIPLPSLPSSFFSDLHPHLQPFKKNYRSAQPSLLTDYDYDSDSEYDSDDDYRNYGYDSFHYTKYRKYDGSGGFRTDSYYSAQSPKYTQYDGSGYYNDFYSAPQPKYTKYDDSDFNYRRTKYRKYDGSSGGFTMDGYYSAQPPKYTKYDGNGYYNDYYSAPPPKHTKYIVNAYHYTGSSATTEIVHKDNRHGCRLSSVMRSFLKTIYLRMLSPNY